MSVVWLAPGAMAPTYSRLAFSVRGASTAKNESRWVKPGGGNCRAVAGEDRPDLVRRATDGRRGRHDLAGALRPAIAVDSRLVEPDHRPRGPLIRCSSSCTMRSGGRKSWSDRAPLRRSEQRADLTLPRHHRELVDRPDDQRRAVRVHVAVDDVDREPIAERAGVVAARHPHPRSCRRPRSCGDRAALPHHGHWRSCTGSLASSSESRAPGLARPLQRPARAVDVVRRRAPGPTQSPMEIGRRVRQCSPGARSPGRR